MLRDVFGLHPNFLTRRVTEFQLHSKMLKVFELLFAKGYSVASENLRKLYIHEIFCSIVLLIQMCETVDFKGPSRLF